MTHSEAAECLVDQLEEAFTKCFPVAEEFLAYLKIPPEVFHAIGSDPYTVGEIVFQWMAKKGGIFFGALRSRDALMNFLESLPDELQNLFPSITEKLKLSAAVSKKEIVRASRNIARDNPDKGGRPPMIQSKEDELKIIKAVGTLHTEGVPVGEAQKRVAKMRGLSVRNVENIWRARGARKPDTYPELYQDFLRLFSPTENAQPIP